MAFRPLRAWGQHTLVLNSVKTTHQQASRWRFSRCERRGSMLVLVSVKAISRRCGRLLLASHRESQGTLGTGSEDLTSPCACCRT